MSNNELKAYMIDVWCLCDSLHTRLEMLGEMSPSFKDGYLVACDYLATMVKELEDELKQGAEDTVP